MGNTTLFGSKEQRNPEHPPLTELGVRGSYVNTVHAGVVALRHGTEELLERQPVRPMSPVTIAEVDAAALGARAIEEAQERLGGLLAGAQSPSPQPLAQAEPQPLPQPGVLDVDAIRRTIAGIHNA